MTQTHDAPTLTLENISHRYGEVEILDALSLVCEPGQAWAIVGANGAGKSTLMQIASGLLSPTAGEVSFGAREVARMARRELARQRAVVHAQSSAQMFDFTALEMVLMGDHANTSRWALPSDSQLARARAMLEKLDLLALDERPATVLSSGELQRVMLARALMTGAPWLMLDEPTANLDMRHQLLVTAQIREHCARGGGALVILHDLSLIEANFDQVIILHDRQLAAHGPPHQAMSEELLSEVFQVNMRAVPIENRRLWYADAQRPE